MANWLPGPDPIRRGLAVIEGQQISAGQEVNPAAGEASAQAVRPAPPNPHDRAPRSGQGSYKAQTRTGERLDAGPGQETEIAVQPGRGSRHPGRNAIPRNTAGTIPGHAGRAAATRDMRRGTYGAG